MRVSLEWLSDFVDLPSDVDTAQLVYDLTMKTVEVEHAARLGDRLRDTSVGAVLSVSSAAGGEQVVECDIGRTVPVRTRESIPEVGSYVAVSSRRGHVLPSAHDLGVETMFSSEELDLHQFLNLSQFEPTAGQPLAELLGWDDTVLEIDNKSLTNRPDLWSHHGIARELAAIYDCELRHPRTDHGYILGERNQLVGDLDPSVCDRFSVMEITTRNPIPTTPLWMRSRLARVGQRTINLYADLTNYVMHAVGQPSHVYDKAKVSVPFSVEISRQPATLDLLDGGRHEVPAGTPIIADGTGPCAIAGVVGGSDSKVDDGTTSIYLEMATFEPSPIRRASLDLGVRTDSSVRFEKGMDTQRVDIGRGHLLHLLASVDADARVTGLQDVCERPTPEARIEVDADFLHDRVGGHVDSGRVEDILTRLGFRVALADDRFTVEVPTWRSTGDVSLSEDLVEEIARIVGYESFEDSAPAVRLRILPSRPRGWLERQVREHLAFRCRMQEIVTYPWAADRYLHLLGFDKNATLTFEGAPSPDRNSLRPSLLPNTLEAVEANLGHATSLRVFELGTVFGIGPRTPLTEPGELLPPEAKHLSGALVGRELTQMFRDAHGAIESMKRACGIVSLETTSDPKVGWADPVARLGLTADGHAVGVIGALSNHVLHALGMRHLNVVCFEVSLSSLSVHRSRDNRYHPVSPYPQVAFDLSVVVDRRTQWAEIRDTAAHVETEVLRRVEFIDEFAGGSIPVGKKSVTLRCILGSFVHTLDSAEAAEVRDLVVAKLEADVGAEVRA